ncbi:MAG: PH domain-containing protein, partial [Actinobacteria bacterium]|nr:PH domain-containing protein [Actinomycetota bacterium]
MPYPTDLLAEGEQVIVDTRLHWIALYRELLYGAGLLVLVIVLLAATNFPGWLYLAAFLVWTGLSYRRLGDWFTSELILTSRRIVFRSGLVTKKGHEIAIGQVSEVGLRQKPLQRMVGAGDLIVESGGDARTALTDVGDVVEVKRLILETSTRIEPKRPHVTLPGPAGAGPSRVEQLDILARLHEQGRLTDDEFEAEKGRL